MAESSLPSAADSSDGLTLVEKLVELRLLVLGLAFLFYLDIWALRGGIDPMSFTADDLTKHIQAVPVFKLVLFVTSFSVIMGALFPALRSVYGLARVYFWPPQHSLATPRDASERRLSNWALGMVLLSAYDLYLGWLQTSGYRGAAWYLTQLLGSDSFEVTVFRLTCVGFWFVCVALAGALDA
jgi:hypothetical protein